MESVESAEAERLAPATPSTLDAEVRQYLRSLARTQGYWDPRAWLYLREEVWCSGHLRLLRLLHEGVQDSTAQALLKGGYKLQGGRSVELPERRAFTTLVSQQTAQRPPLEGADAKTLAAARFSTAPLAFTAAEELDAGVAALDGQQCAVAVVGEVAHFSEDGRRIDLRPGASSLESSLLLRTNVCEIEPRTGERLTNDCTMRDRLTSAEGASVLLLPAVTVLRGRGESGFPFLERPQTLDLVLCGRSFRTAALQRFHGQELFAQEAEEAALAQRLATAALAALQTPLLEARLDDAPRASAGLHLVLGLRPGIYPRHSLAKCLASWHRDYAHHFSGVTVACGGGTQGEDLAQALDALVNGDPLIHELEAAVESGTHGGGAVAASRRLSAELLDQAAGLQPPLGARSVTSRAMTGSSRLSTASSVLSSSRRYNMLHLDVLRKKEAAGRRLPAAMARCDELSEDCIFVAHDKAQDEDFKPRNPRSRSARGKGADAERCNELRRAARESLRKKLHAAGTRTAARSATAAPAALPMLCSRSLATESLLPTVPESPRPFTAR